MKKIITLLAFLALFSSTAFARIYIPVDQPSDKKFPIAITTLLLKQGGSAKVAEDVPAIIKNDLILSGYFDIIPESAFLDFGTGLTADSINFSKWTAIEAGALIKGSVQKEEGRYIIQLKLFDPYSAQMLVGKQYTATSGDLRSVAHRFSDEVMEALTGIRGIFNTKIAYSAITGKSNKAIYIMDVDGEENQRITRDSSLDLGPAWSPDGGRLAYASYKKGNPEIYVAELGSGNVKQITRNGNSNITPGWYVDGKTIYYAQSLNESTELFAAEVGTAKSRQVSSAGGINIAPRFSKDGSTMIYSSTRAGRLHVYREPVGGGGAQRLTFVGVHNDSPDISPDGSKIVFCGQDLGTFDIFTMNSDGTNIQRLTIESGSNEHPRWSPDGRYIVFSSTRDGGAAVYMMRSDGSNQIRISKGNGALPDWGPWLK
jgi:TolB protein